MEDAISEESGNDRKNRSWQKEKLLTRGGGKGLWFAVSRWRQKIWRKNKSPKIWKASSRFDWAKG